MWIFSQHGFVSVVAYDPKKDPKAKKAIRSRHSHLLVRARVREDLEDLREQYFPKMDIEEDKSADYLFRAVVPRELFKRMLCAEVDGINYYGHFKEAAARHSKGAQARYSAYMAVWSAIAKLQPHRPYSGSSWNWRKNEDVKPGPPKPPSPGSAAGYPAGSTAGRTTEPDYWEGTELDGSYYYGGAPSPFVGGHEIDDEVAGLIAALEDEDESTTENLAKQSSAQRAKPSLPACDKCGCLTSCRSCEHQGSMYHGIHSEACKSAAVWNLAPVKATPQPDGKCDTAGCKCICGQCIHQGGSCVHTAACNRAFGAKTYYSPTKPAPAPKPTSLKSTPPDDKPGHAASWVAAAGLDV